MGALALAATCFILFFATFLCAQSTTGTGAIRGIVTDSTAKVVPDAAVTITGSLLIQRMLAAKIAALAEKFRVPDLITDADKTIAAALLITATAIQELVENRVRTVL